MLHTRAPHDIVERTFINAFQPLPALQRIAVRLLPVSPAVAQQRQQHRSYQRYRVYLFFIVDTPQLRESLDQAKAELGGRLFALNADAEIIPVFPPAVPTGGPVVIWERP